MSTILIVCAGQDGFIGEAADLTAAEMRGAGHEVVIAPADHAPDPRHADAVIVGSELRRNHWARSAVAYLEHHAPDLAERPTFLFQVVIDPSSHSHTPRDVQRLVFEIGTAGPQSFDLDHTPEHRRKRVLAWARHVAADLASPVEGIPSALWPHEQLAASS